MCCVWKNCRKVIFKSRFIYLIYFLFSLFARFRIYLTIIINVEGLKKKKRNELRFILSIERIKGDKVLNGERIEIFLNTLYRCKI